jgi:hypothetical protein
MPSAGLRGASCGCMLAASIREEVEDEGFERGIGGCVFELRWIEGAQGGLEVYICAFNAVLLAKSCCAIVLFTLCTRALDSAL